MSRPQPWPPRSLGHHETGPNNLDSTSSRITATAHTPASRRPPPTMRRVCVMSPPHPGGNDHVARTSVSRRLTTRLARNHHLRPLNAGAAPSLTPAKKHHGTCVFQAQPRSVLPSATRTSCPPAHGGQESGGFSFSRFDKNSCFVLPASSTGRTGAPGSRAGAAATS